MSLQTSMKRVKHTYLMSCHSNHVLTMGFQYLSHSFYFSIVLIMYVLVGCSVDATIIDHVLQCLICYYFTIMWWTIMFDLLCTILIELNVCIIDCSHGVLIHFYFIYFYLHLMTHSAPVLYFTQSPNCPVCPHFPFLLISIGMETYVLDGHGLI